MVSKKKKKNSTSCEVVSSAFNSLYVLAFGKQSQFRLPNCFYPTSSKINAAVDLKKNLIMQQKISWTYFTKLIHFDVIIITPPSQKNLFFKIWAFQYKSFNSYRCTESQNQIRIKLNKDYNMTHPIDESKTPCWR